ncbi:hypothetical protein VNX24_25070 [Citrobacter farmeri]|uniref:hypothetical protein n=1 Tax=Citrobacter farmeri TaxID=67824 RepID=UPI002DBC3824|nr:hypothetical protein [Citrobacter farmeri]MEC3934470.1 hypothetical protein [Citrobacter farmeri]
MIEALLASLKTSWRWWLAILAVVIVVGAIAILCVLLTNSQADLSIAQSDKRVLEHDNALQGQVIAAQAFNFNLFNQVAENASRLNSLIDAGTEKTVIEYREILRREKTCNLPVPADVAGGLLEYANSLRSRAMRTNSGGLDETDDRTVAASNLTYCQAVLWIKPLLASIEKANNQLSGIREIEKNRASQ